MTFGILRHSASPLMSDGYSRLYVRTVVLSLVLLVSMGSTAIASQGGVNEEASVDGTGVETVLHPGESSAGEVFEVTVGLNDESSNNVTVVSWITQVCINSGVCYPPETNSMIEHSSTEWRGTIVPEDTVTYVNWKIEIQWEDGNTTSVPETGFGWKVWSDCWYDNGTWGGSSTECQEEASDFIPGFAAPLVMASISMAALMIWRE